MDRTRHLHCGRPAALRRASTLEKTLVAVMLLALTGTASAQTPPGSNGVSKHRGFTITPPWQRSKSYTMSCGYDCGLHKNGGTQDYFALDFLMARGEPVHPVAPGKVRIAKMSPNCGFEPYGKFVLIAHGNGYYSMYAHLDSISVSVNTWVDVDVPIGTAGMTGSGSNDVNHLHFALYKDLTSINADDASFSGGSAVVPEPFSGCTKSPGGDCENIAGNNILRRDDFAPEVIVHPDGRLDLFTCNRNLNLMYRGRTAAGSWAPWENLEGTCASSPAAVRDDSGNVFVFVRGIDGELYAKWRSGALWSGWYLAGIKVFGRATAALDTASRLVRVFVRKQHDHSLYFASQQATGSPWFPVWQRLGGPLTNSPVAGRRPDGRVDVYAAAPNYTFWRLAADSDGTYTSGLRYPQNVAIEGEPSLVAQEALEWVVRSTSDDLVAESGGTDQTATHRPAVARNLNGQLYMFERDRSDSSADLVYDSNGMWHRDTFGGLVTSELAAIRAGTGNRIIMFTWGMFGLYYREQTAANTNSWSDWIDLQIP
jgi:murein DD-endopeptidase MepM/ murein hydrolase activator NlpD